MPPSRREELVEAAMGVFARHGYHATNLDRVLEEAGVSRMTLYNHFKSKDDLILAALRRRDETFRLRLHRFIEKAAADPRARLLAVFDFLETWFTEPDYHGCMFINAAAEFDLPDAPVRRLAAEHKRAVVALLAELCVAAGLDDPAAVAEQLNLLVEGATVSALVVGQVYGGDSPAGAAAVARDAARTIIESAAR